MPANWTPTDAFSFEEVATVREAMALGGPRTSSCSASPSLPGHSSRRPTPWGLPSYSSLVAMGAHAWAHARRVSISSNFCTVPCSGAATCQRSTMPGTSVAQRHDSSLAPANNFMASPSCGAGGHEHFADYDFGATNHRLPPHGLPTPFSPPDATITFSECKSGKALATVRPKLWPGFFGGGMNPFVLGLQTFYK